MVRLKCSMISAAAFVQDWCEAKEAPAQNLHTVYQQWCRRFAASGEPSQ